MSIRIVQVIGCAAIGGIAGMFKNQYWGKVEENTVPSATPPVSGSLTIKQQMPTFEFLAGNSESSGYTIGITSAAMIVYFAFLYRLSDWGVEQVVDKVIRVKQEIIETINKGEECNKKRSDELDDRENERTSELVVEIKSEQRAQHEILSKQSNCLTQICLQTIGAIGTGVKDTDTDEPSNGLDPNDLHNYIEKVQDKSENVIDRSTYVKELNTQKEKIRGEITFKKGPKKLASPTKQMINRSSNMDMDSDNDDVKHNVTHVRKASTPYNTNTTQSNNKPNEYNKSILQIVNNVKSIVFSFINNHKKEVTCVTLAGVFVVGYKQYSKSSNDKDKLVSKI